MKFPLALLLISLHLPNTHDSLSYAGYRIARVRARPGGWGVRLTPPSGKPLEFSTGGDAALPTAPEYVSLGLGRLLAGDSRQFVASVWTGGAHCCHFYWIVDLLPSSCRVIFDSRRYGKDELQLMEAVEDIDRDGNSELIFRNRLGGWNAAGFAYWPAPLQIFRFDPDRQAYVPANDRFPARATRELPELLRAIRAGGHNSEVLTAALTLVYAGRTAEAQTLITRHGEQSWREFVAMLRKDPFYQELTNGISSAFISR